ncbi:MAG: TIGR01777 family protein [Micrococcales bacterium]|nr:TIGR01777 family protein [Micrococcales bacterium]NBR60819.1 TIGR01777 family protein [Actinomycetota bacterium]NBR54722.1 TIGR01777 family protein [Micrococcales bacterium]NBT47790.1 TIGR01777 family protein [Actinomycetota bacterium]NBY43532.1 TIGR01777 family protein [Micrococcales bacterium]
MRTVQGLTVRILISGASGLIGTELQKQISARADTPLVLVRRAPTKENEVQWNPTELFIEPDVIETVDAVINLAGATTGKLPWTKKYKEELISSRIMSTRTLVQAISKAKNKPKVFVSGSASGIYGDCGDQLLLETAPKGAGFLADLANQWEREAMKAPNGVRVVLVRTTMVLSRKLGALGRLLPILRLGIGGKLGNGKQWWAWISLPDEARAILHLIDTVSASGPYNLTAPEPATAKQLIKALGKELKRPTLIPIPAFALKLAFREGAQELLLCSQKMSADRLLATGFKFEQPTLESAAKWVCAKTE